MAVTVFDYTHRLFEKGKMQLNPCYVFKILLKKMHKSEISEDKGSPCEMC